MKKTIGLILFIILLSNSSFSQIPVKWGINLGLTSSNQKFYYTNTNTSREYDFRPGIEFGVFGEFFNFPNLSFVGEISYIQKGTQDKDINVSRQANNPQGYEDMGHLDLRFDYLSLTTLAKGKYNLGWFTPFVFIGPSLNYLVDGNEQADFGLDKYNKLVIGYSAGLGTEFEIMSPFSIIMEVVYNQDITKAYKDDVGYIKNNSFGFLIGAKF